MSRTLRIGTALAAIVLALPLAPRPSLGADEGDISVVLRPLAGRKVAQGLPFPFELVATNHSSETRTIDLTFELSGPGGPLLPGLSEPLEAVRFERWVETIPAKGKARYTGRVTPGQWFAGRGRFAIGMHTPPAEVLGSPVEATDASEIGDTRLSFKVTKSPIRVPRFREVGEDRGIATWVGNFNSSVDSCGNWTAGAAWGDVDGDGRPDLFLPRRDEPPELWMNRKGGFVDEAAARGITVEQGLALGAVFVDFDNDGDADLYVTSDGPNMLFRNDGNGSFEEVATAAGVDDDRPSQSASWGDYDGDGLLDLYVSNHLRCNPMRHYSDRLYRNEGDGTFSDQTDLLSATGPTTGAGFQAAWFDYDGDGDLDIYMVNDFIGTKPEPNQLWRNDGPGDDGTWKFTNVSLESGTKLNMNSMGIAVGDYDRDLDFDVAISNIYSTVLLRNQGDGTFTDVAQRARVDRPFSAANSRSVTWGLSFLDANNDGWEDLYVMAGRISGERLFLNGLFTNAGHGRFLDHSAPSATADPGVGRGLAVADFDSDGRLDLFVVSQNDRPKLFRNVTSRKNANWLQVRPVGTVSARDSCGAKVTVRARGIPDRLTRQIMCGGTSLGSGHDHAAHFGLGPSTRVKRVVIEWLSGQRVVLRGLPVNRSFEVEEPLP